MSKNSKKNNKKIGILTYHFAYNYGAMLQAYALQAIINRYSECEIISYEPYYHTRLYVPKIRYYINIKNEKNPINIVKTILYGTYMYFKEKNYCRKHNFESFQKYLIKSKKLLTVDDLKDSLHNYDKVIVGSDQIWKKEGSYRLEYFLDFKGLKAQKYSFAASAGNCFYQEDMAQIKSLLRDFKYVSVREKKLADQLNQYGINSRCDVDPTLLLNCQDYLKLEKKVKINKKYIYVYLCCDERAISVLEHISKVLDAEVIFGPYVSFSSDMNFKYRTMEYLGPREFIYCVHNADFIITSSFHCTVFSILFNKPFLVFDGVQGFERIQNLLTLTKLQNHIFRQISEVDFENDYTKANSIISHIAKLSKDYLYQIISE